MSAPARSKNTCGCTETRRRQAEDRFPDLSRPRRQDHREAPGRPRPRPAAGGGGARIRRLHRPARPAPAACSSSSTSTAMSPSAAPAPPSAPTCSPPSSTAASPPAPKPASPAGSTPPSSAVCSPCVPAFAPASASGTTCTASPSPPSPERDIVAAMTREFGLDLRQVLFDATNFFTYIDSFNERSQLAQRGHSKEGRRSLRIIGVRPTSACPCCIAPIPATGPTRPCSRASPPTCCPALPGDRRRRRDGHLGLRQGQQLAREPGLGRARPLPLHRCWCRPRGTRTCWPCRRTRCAREAEGWLACAPTAATTRCSASSARCWFWNQALFDAQCRTLCVRSRRASELRALQQQLRRWREGFRGGRKPGLPTTQKKVDGWLRARHMRDCSTSKCVRRMACRG